MCPSEDSKSSLSAWRKLGSLATHWAHREDSDQIGRMPRLIWVSAGRTCHFVGFVVRQLICWWSVFSQLLIVSVEKQNNWARAWQNQQNIVRPTNTLIRVFAVCMKKHWDLDYPMSAQQRLWSESWLGARFIFVNQRASAQLSSWWGILVASAFSNAKNKHRITV